MTDAAPAIAPDARGVVAVIRDTPFYRAAFLSLLFGGTASAAALPQLTLFFTGELGASLSLSGLYFLTGLAAPIAGFAIGRLSDRRGDRLPLMRVCALAGAAGWLAMAMATEMWMAFVISLTALSVTGATGALLFAAARDELSRHPTTADNRIVSTIRLAFTLGWVVGPVLGSWFGAVAGSRALFVGVAVLLVLQLVPLIGQRVERHVITAPTALASQDHRRADLRAMLPLLAFGVISSVALSGDTLKFSFLPVYMERDLGVSDATRGAVIAIQPFLELLLMPLFAVWADRIGAWRIVFGGLCVAIAANLTFATSDDVVGLFAGQILMATVWAAMAGLGVSVAQQLYPQGVGVASTTFFSSLAVASTIGGLVASVGVGPLGLPGVFFIPAALTTFAVAGMFVLGVVVRRRDAVTPPPAPA